MVGRRYMAKLGSALVVMLGVLAGCMPVPGAPGDAGNVPGEADASRWSPTDFMPAAGELRLLANQYEVYGQRYAQGQLVSSAEWPGLAKVLDYRFGGDRPEAFKLPALAPIQAGGVALHYRITMDGSRIRSGEMAEGYIGEIRLWTGEQGPAGWLPCDGRELSIAAHQPLYSLIGTSFGGDGQRSFKLPVLEPVDGVRYLINYGGIYPSMDHGGGEPMAIDAYLSEIRMFTGPNLPSGWRACDGATYTIREKTALFALLGNRFGGDGKTTYQLPKLNFEAHPTIHYAIAVSGIFPSRP